MLRSSGIGEVCISFEIQSTTMEPGRYVTAGGSSSTSPISVGLIYIPAAFLPLVYV